MGGALILLLFSSGEMLDGLVGLEHDASRVLARLHHDAALAVDGPLHYDVSEETVQRLEHSFTEGAGG